MTVNISKPEFNIREKLKELDHKLGQAGKAVLEAETPQEQFNLIGAGRKNILINGNFRISQRSTNGFTSSSTIADGNYYFDRWENRITGVSVDLIATSGAYDYPNHISAKLTATSSANGKMRFLQRTEGWFKNQELTLSAWVRSNHPDARVFCYYPGAQVRASSKPHSGKGGWEKLTVTYIDDANVDNAGHYDVAIAGDGFTDVYIPSGSYIEVAEVQLELGPVATPFEYRSLGEELALCQRYYTMLAGGADWPELYSGGSSHTFGTIHKWNTANTFIFTELPVMMRTSSYNIVKSSGSADFSFKSAGYTSTGNDIALDGDSSTRMVRLNSAVTNSNWPLGGAGWIRCNTTSAFIALDAEF